MKTADIETPAQPAADLQAQMPAYVLPRPGNPVSKALLKGPILMWRLGLGPLLGRRLLILTTTGRKSGLPRRTVVGSHEQGGRKYVLTLRGPHTDWYCNLLADPHVTIQAPRGRGGGEQAIARRVLDERELGEAYDFLAALPIMQQWAGALGVQLSRAEVIAHKDDFILIAFDPVGAQESQPAPNAYPPPLKTDLWWVWPLGEAVALLGWLVIRAARRPAPRG